MLLIVVLGVSVCHIFSVFAVSGTGIQGDPYLVSSAEDLLLIGDFPSSHFKLTKNIQLDEIYGAWSSAGSFSGVLDGNGYMIIGLDRPLVSRNEGTIKNLIVQIDGLERAGFIGTNAEESTAYVNDGGKVYHCYYDFGLN